MVRLKSIVAKQRRLFWRSLKQLGSAWRTLKDAPAVLSENARRPNVRSGFVVLDDVFPLPWSGFRVAEFNAYLDALPNAEIHSSDDRLSSLGSAANFAEIVAEYERVHPSYRGRIRKFNAFRRLDDKAGAYSLFAGTTLRYLRVLESSRVPLLFTLYPGGGFAIDDAQSDARLRRIFDSKVFRKVIATQTITRDYLLSRGLCDADRIEFIYGGVFRSAELTAQPLPHQRYAFDKRSLDICFVAHKYMPQGKDKGYDRFILTAQLLAARHQDVHFHVVGPFSAVDVPITGLDGRITFYGSQPTAFFPGFYANMDLIVSPNLPFVLRKGAFDGFPTGACMEAGMCGVGVLCTDSLGLNLELRDGEDLVIIVPEPAHIADVVSQLRADPEHLRRLGESASTSFRHLFGVEHQMPPRLRLVSELVGQPAPPLRSPNRTG